jgi:serine/threonine protein kinase/Tol biopolymer transport system component
MTLNPGSRIGPYEIVGPLGAGGMGEVYRARDARLGRDVAIKVLPATLASDAERLRRFEIEARAVAALNHPNILSIHDIGTHEGTPYLVSECLEGQTLRQELAGGPLPLRRAVEYGKELAQGLAAAHDKGIVHRDLKPENIFVTRDGRIKILDFGLAKLVNPEGSADQGATLEAEPTSVGAVLGTAGYMSPEQVRGESADARSDIFALGTILYEMLSGQRAFRRDTSAETMTAILKEDPPDLAELTKPTPPAVERIVRRCLEKKPLQRFQSARDLAFNLEGISGNTGSATATHVPEVVVPRNFRPWVGAALAVIAVAALVWYVAGRRPFTPPVKFKRLTYQKGYLPNARFAKDGGTVVYSAQWESEPFGIYTVRTEFPQSTKVDVPSAILFAVASSGEMEIGVAPVHHTNFQSGTMSQSVMAGGAPRAQTNDVISADYAPDGKTLAIVRSANQKVQVEYPAGKVIYATSGYLDYVRVSPDGKTVAFAEHPVYDDDRGWVAVVDEQGNHKQLTSEYSTLQGIAWSRTGKEIWYTASPEGTDRQLLGVELSGKQRRILAIPTGMRLLDIAPDGRLLIVAEDMRSEISGIDPATGKERKGLQWFNGSGLADVAPDGKAVLYEEWGGPAGTLYLAVYRKLDGSPPTALGEGTTPRFSPDGLTAAAPVLSRPPKVALHPIGTGESRRFAVGDLASLRDVAWFPDGKHLMLVGSAESEPLRTYEMDLDGGKPQPVGPSDFRGISVAKDGMRIVGIKASGEAVIFDTSTQKLQAIPGIGPGESVQGWTDDGQAVLLTASTPWEAQIYRVEVGSGKRNLLQKFELEDKAGSSLNIRALYKERSKTYVYNVRRILSNLYVVEGLE